jgi:DNA-directed RNA polymerase specialized sigma24 family protein
MQAVGKGTRPIAGVVTEQVLALAARGAAIEVIARKLGTSRYRVEKLVGGGPAGRDDVPYRYRELFAQSDISTRYRAGESAERIAYDLGISVTTVFAVLHREGAALRGKCEPHRTSYADILTEAFLQTTYVEAEMGAWEIAAEVGCSESTVRNWLRRHGIPVRPISTRRRAYEFSADLLDQVSSGVVAVEAAAGLVGCSRSELTRALRRAGRTLPHERRVALTRELLVALYVDQGQSCPEISAETGWAIGTVRSRLRGFGIPCRIGRPAQS